jgi:AcrR family transcriptional regulator
VAQNQRERLLTALSECLYERGYEKTTVAAIGKRAAVSKSDFYRHFESKEACFLAAYEEAVERIRQSLLSGCAVPALWQDRVLGALASLLADLAAEPAWALLALVEGMRAGRCVFDLHQAALRSFVPYLRAGAPAPPGGVPPPATTDEAVVGGVAALLTRRVLAGETGRLRDLLPEIGEFALTPYLGAAEAHRMVSGR